MKGELSFKFYVVVFILFAVLALAVAGLIGVAPTIPVAP